MILDEVSNWRSRARGLVDDIREITVQLRELRRKRSEGDLAAAHRRLAQAQVEFALLKKPIRFTPTTPLQAFCTQARKNRACDVE